MEKLKDFIHGLANFVVKLIKVNLIAAVVGVSLVVIIANIVSLVKGEGWLYLGLTDIPKVASGCCRFATILYLVSRLGNDAKDSFEFVILFSGAIILFQAATGIPVFTTSVEQVDYVVLTILFWIYWFMFCV